MTDISWGGFALNLAVTTTAVAVFIALIMAAAVRLHNHSIIDIFWGPGFVLVAAVSYLVSAGSEGDDGRRLVVLLATGVWGVRLGAHVGRRNAGHGQDRRYTALLRSRRGPLVPFLLRQIYGLQALLILVVSLPVQLAMYQHAELGAIGLLGVVVWTIGFGFEAIGDWQLARFKADPAHAGQIMDRGLWAWTRHPNYFGDSCVWVGLFLLALGSPWGLLTVVSPVVMTRLLVSYSGKALLERGMRRRRGEAYARYAARTSGFFPFPPRRSAGAGQEAR